MLTLRRLLPILTVVASIVISFAAYASQPFDAKSFQQAQAAGRSILIDVTAPWCPTCRKQRPLFKQIAKDRPNLVVFEVDFDAAKDVLRRFRVQHQSTLIMFKGRTEVGRSTGDTDPNRIQALVSKGL